MRLYRGINVSPNIAENVTAEIYRNGLQALSDEIDAVDLRPRIEELFLRNDLSAEETRKSRRDGIHSGY